MIKDAAKALREPIAWVLLGCVMLRWITGLWDWFGKPSYDEDHWFLYNSYYDVNDFISLDVGVALAAAVVIVTLLPNATKRARAVVITDLATAGAMLLFGLITLFLGVFYSGSKYSDVGFGDRAQHFFFYLPSLAYVLIPLLLGLALLRTREMSPPRGPQGPQPGQQWGGFPQQQGVPGYQQPPAMQQPQPQQPPPYGWPTAGQPPDQGYGTAGWGQ